MKILLVMPATQNQRVTVNNQQPLQRAMLRFSVLPLTTVAALTPSEHQVSICDENVQQLDFAADVDLVSVSFMTAYAPRAYEISQEFRNRGKIVVAGGYHPTFMPTEVSSHFDAIVIGDAEELWPQLLQDATNSKLKRIYQHTTPPSLDHTPPPRRELVNITAQHYATTDAVQTSRGCVHNCRYCSVTAFNCRVHRQRPLNNVLEELQGIGQDFIFVDDNIIADPDYARELFRKMIPLKKRWVSQASLMLADDPGLMQLASKAGCKGLFIGIETTNPQNLATVDKKFNDAEKYTEKIKRIRANGIAVIAGMIVGMDDDQVDVFETTLSFLLKANIDGLQLNILTPLPGTPLFDDYSTAGRITDNAWQNYDYRHVVFRPARMTAKELQNGADWLYREFYRLDRILKRSVNALLTMGPVQAWLTLKLNMTYLADNKREKLEGRNPALDYRKTVETATIKALNS